MLAAAQPAPALAGYMILEQKGEVIENLMQNSLVQAPDYPYESERLGCVTPAERKSRQEATTCPSLRDIRPCQSDPVRR